MSTGLFLVLAGAAVAILAEVSVMDCPPGAGWLLLVVGTAVTVETVALRLERRTDWTVGLIAMPSAVAVAMTLYDAHAVRGLGPWICALGLVGYAAWRLPHARSAFGLLGRLLPGSRSAFVADTFKHGLVGLREAGSLQPDSVGNLHRVMRGLALSVPLLLVFGALFWSADALFQDAIRSLAEPFSPEAGRTGLRVLFLTALVVGLLRASLFAEPLEEEEPRPGGGDPLVISVTLGCLNLLFLLFVSLQLRYLSDGIGADQIAHLSRKGFFELCLCTMLVLALVAAVYREGYRRDGHRAPRVLSTSLVLLTYAVALSAVGRMVLYIETFGMSVLRFYASAGMASMCLFLALTLYSSWRGHSLSWWRSRLAASLLAVVSLVALCDVEGTVARINVDRTFAGKTLDVEYLGRLSSDAAPHLARLLKHSDPAVRNRGRTELARLTSRLGPQPWSSWNASRRRAEGFAGPVANTGESAGPGPFGDGPGR